MAEERAQRRLAAILAADVVGYSRLMEQDEVGTLRALKERRKSILQPQVTEHSGRIVKVMGDGVLVEFASAVKAVACAVKLQEHMASANVSLSDDRHIVLRIGINLGDIMVEGSDLYGDGVNIAARLEGIAEPGDILISGTVYDYVKNKVEFGFNDLGARTLKNIEEPVRVYRVANTPTAYITAPKAAAAKPSIAVLPFINMSSDPEQEYFSDGVTEDIITELSQFPTLRVIARNSCFQYRGKSSDLRRVGRELSAKYIVEGSVRRLGTQIRITAQLIDSETNDHLWAHRYDQKLDELFDMQDAVVREVVATLEHRIADSHAVGARRRPPQNWAAYDYVLQARQLTDRFDVAASEVPLRRAIELDPTLAEAHARIAYPIAFKYFNDGDVSHLTSALEAARNAVKIDDKMCLSHAVLAWVHMLLGQHELAGVHYSRALVLNPNDVDTRILRTFWLINEGRTEEALASLDAVMETDPFPPSWYWEARGVTLFHLHRYQDSISAISKMVTIYSWNRACLAAAYAQLGQLREAHQEIESLRRSDPNISVATILKVAGFEKNAAATADLSDGLRKAGLSD
jgi:TolB-like protein